MKHHAWLAGLVLFCFSLAAAAQKNEPISAAVRAALHQAIGDLAARPAGILLLRPHGRSGWRKCRGG